MSLLQKSKKNYFPSRKEKDVGDNNNSGEL